MRLLDLAIASIAPGYALKRMQARQSIKAFYEAAQTTRLHKRRVDKRDADSINLNEAEKLRINARHLDENLDLVSGGLDTLVDNVIGLGIQPEPQVKTIDGELATEVNRQLLKLWRDWIRYPEVTWELDYYSAQRLQARTWFRDGECLTQLLEGNIRRLDHGTQVPFSIELLEPDYLPFSFNDSSKGIVQGVQKNVWGRPRKYHIYKTHPGSNAGLIVRQDTKTVPAEQMIHLKNCRRINQTRGVSMLATVLNRLDDIKEIEESERVAARVAAAMSGFIKKGSPELYIAPPDGEYYREMDFVPGMIFDDLQMGEEVQAITSNRPNNQVIPFRDANMRAVASGLGTSYSSIAKDYSGTFSSQRQELVESYCHYGTLWAYFTARNVEPTYARFSRTAITARLLSIDSTIDISTLTNADYSRPAMPWVDPVKEVKALREAIEIKIKSRSQAIRERGGNPDEVLKQIAKEHQDDIDSGLVVEQTLEEPPENPEEQEMRQAVLQLINHER